MTQHDERKPDSFQHLQDTLAHLEHELAQARTEEHKAELLSSIGRLYEDALSQGDQALFYYKRALDYQPADEKALDGVARILAQQMRHRELEELLEQSIGLTPDRNRQARLQFQRALLCLEKLGKPDLAIRAFEAVLELDPFQKTVYPLLDRLYRERQDWRAVLANAGAWMDLTQDKALAITIMNGMAEIWLDHLADMEKAREALEEILLLDAENIPALRNLERLYRGQNRFEELVAVLERQAGLLAFRPPQDQVRIGLELAELYALKLSEPEAAETNLRRVLVSEPANARARELLAGIHEARANWIELIQVYRADLDLVTEAKSRAERLLRIAEITETHLGRTEEATELYREAYRVLRESGNPAETAVEALRARLIEPLVRRLRLEGRKEELRDLFLAQYEEAKTLADRTASLQHLMDLGESDLAERSALELIEISKNLPLASQTEVRLKANKKLANLYLAQEQWERLIEVYRQQVPLLEAAAERAILHFRSGEILSLKLGRFEEAAWAYREALDLNPSLTPALRARRELLVKLERYREACDLLQTEISLTSGPRARSALYFQVGCLREDHLNEAETAVHAFEQALDLDPENERALRRLAVQYYQTSQWAKAEPLFDRLATLVEKEAPDDPMKKAAFWARRARIAERLDHLEAGVEFLKKSLTIEAHFVPAFEMLGEIYFRLHNWQDAKRFYLDYLGFTKSESQKAASAVPLKQAYRHLAHIEERLANEPEAIRFHQKVLEVDAFDVETLEALINLQSKAENWNEVQRLYDSVLRSEGKGGDWVTIQFAKAEIWENRLQRPKNAIGCYRAVLERDPLNSLALERLAHLHCQIGDLDEGIAILERLIRGETDSKRLIQFHYALGRVYRLGKKMLPAAEEQYRHVLHLDPDDLGTLKELTEIFSTRGAHPELARIYQQIIRVVKMRDPLMAIPFYVKLGNLFRTELDDVTQAIAAYKSVIGIDADNVGARNSLVELYASHESFHEEAIRQHRRLLQADPLRVSSYRTIAQIYFQRQEYDRAFCLYKILEALGEASAEEMAFLGKAQTALPSTLRSELSESLRQEVLVHPAEKNLLNEVFRVLRDPLRELFWDPALFEQTEAPLGPFARQMSECLEQISPVLQITTPKLRILKSTEAVLLPMGGLDPVFIASSGFLRGNFAPPERFQIIRVLDSLVNGREWTWRFTSRQLEKLFLVMMKFFYPELEVGDYPERELKEDLKRFKKVFPKKTHGVVKELLSQVARSWEQFDFASWSEGVRSTGSRVALLLTGDFEAALGVVTEEENLSEALGHENRAGLSRLGAVARSAALRDLLVYAASEDYFRLRLRVGRALQPGRLQLQ